MHSHRIALAFLVAAAAGGCGQPTRSQPVMPAHDLIAADELAGSSEIYLYDAIRRLRPAFLKPRGIAAYGAPETTVLTLYVDGQRMDSIDDLRRISCDEVLEVRFYEPQTANAKFAAHNNSGGAIAVTLKPLPGDVPATIPGTPMPPGNATRPTHAEIRGRRLPVMDGGGEIQREPRNLAARLSPLLSADFFRAT